MLAIDSEAAAREDKEKLMLENHRACTHMHTTPRFANHDSQSGLRLRLLSVQDEICQAVKRTFTGSPLPMAACC